MPVYLLISLMIATLNDIEVKLGDFWNAYLQALVTEKVWTVVGPEFSKDAGKSAVIVRALYCLKSAVRKSPRRKYIVFQN